MKRCKTPSFIHEFELAEPGEGGFRQIDRVQDHARRLCNALLGKLKKKVTKVKASSEWKEARKLPRGSVQRSEAFRAILLREGLTEPQVDEQVKELRVDHLKDFVGSHVAQKVGARVWQAIEKLISGKGKRVRFKKQGEFFTIEAKDNKSFLRLIQREQGPPFIQLCNSHYELKLDPQCPYQAHALSSPCKYVRLLKRKIQCRVRYFAQIICEGVPFNDIQKVDRHKQKMKDFLGEEALVASPILDPKYHSVVCVDFGPKNIAISTATHSFERSIVEGFADQSKEIRRIQRSMDRSLRAMNPENYNPNGTIVKGKKKWNKSNSYLKKQEKKASLQRKQASHRNSIQGNLSNDVLVLGNRIKLEKISYLGLQKAYGKSVGIHAPASLKDKLTRTAAKARGQVELINTFETKLSQTCLCGATKKKPLHVRVHRCENCHFGDQKTQISRDTLSAFLGVFTENTQTKKGRVLKVSSTLNLEQARLAVMRHRTLSLAGLEALIAQIQTSVGSPSDGVDSQL